MKLIIDMPEDMFEWFKNGEVIDEYDKSALKQVFNNGIPLDDVKAEIMQLDYELESFYYASNNMLQAEMVHTICREEVLQILDNIGKGGE